ncbi:UDP-glycosyltransferase 73C3-like [Rhododendron vialii]|uniref:UDP-glycosyltransferase 73C3-like n=1 Tax=Rhododendron vialii TaxID=182163 RepID=UPI00265FF1EE|nr:UDP-glycosyltransferase 73C3-like [Rhododendron vialii]
MASQNPHQLHFVLFPLMSPGHSIPIIDMAKLLAQNGPTVTIITTPIIAARFRHTIDRATASGLPLRLLDLRFPSAEAGLPNGCETLETVTSPDLLKKFFGAIYMLQQPFQQLLEQLEPKPTCMIVDKYIPWAAETARMFRIPRIVFDVMSCFYLLCFHTLHVSKVHENVPESEPFVLPNFPDTIVLTKSQLPGLFNPGSLDGVHVNEFRERVRVAEAEACGIVLNTFEELEHRYVNEIGKVNGGKIWCIGPLSLCNKDSSDKAQRGDKASIDEIECSKWLDEQEAGSVVYACLGSISRLSSPQLIELGLGLELSKRPFVWVIRGDEKAKEVYKWIEGDGFEERVKGRGLIIRGWAPQVLILDHPSVGAFLTHCGWNSTLEGVCAGVPMVTWPIFAEQFINEKLVGVVLETGVSVGARAVVQMFEEDKSGVAVKREAVRNAVERVMGSGVEAEERRKRAREFGEMAKKAVEEGGSSNLNVKSLIQDMMEQVIGMGPTEDHQ